MLSESWKTSLTGKCIASGRRGFSFLVTEWLFQALAGLYQNHVNTLIRGARAGKLVCIRTFAFEPSEGRRGFPKSFGTRERAWCSIVLKPCPTLIPTYFRFFASWRRLLLA